MSQLQVQLKHKKGKTNSTINDRNQYHNQRDFSSTLHRSISRYLNKKGDNGMFRENGLLDPHAESLKAKQCNYISPYNRAVLGDISSVHQMPKLSLNSHKVKLAKHVRRIDLVNKNVLKVGSQREALGYFARWYEEKAKSSKRLFLCKRPSYATLDNKINKDSHRVQETAEIATQKKNKIKKINAFVKSMNKTTEQFTRTEQKQFEYTQDHLNQTLETFIIEANEIPKQVLLKKSQSKRELNMLSQRSNDSVRDKDSKKLHYNHQGFHDIYTQSMEFDLIKKSKASVKKNKKVLPTTQSGLMVNNKVSKLFPRVDKMDKTKNSRNSLMTSGSQRVLAHQASMQITDMTDASVIPTQEETITAMSVGYLSQNSPYKKFGPVHARNPSSVLAEERYQQQQSSHYHKPFGSLPKLQKLVGHQRQSVAVLATSSVNSLNADNLHKNSLYTSPQIYESKMKVKNINALAKTAQCVDELQDARNNYDHQIIQYRSPAAENNETDSSSNMAKILDTNQKKQLKDFKLQSTYFQLYKNKNKEVTKVVSQANTLGRYNSGLLFKKSVQDNLL